MTGKIVIQNTDLVTKNDVLKAVFSMDTPVASGGSLRIAWTDSYGRTVMEKTVSVEPGCSAVEFSLPLDRAVAMLNFLEARLETGQTVIEVQKTEFIVTPEPHKLDDYSIIMYYPYKPHQQEALRKIGINAGQLQTRKKDQVIDPDNSYVWYRYNYRFYCDQVAVPYYATYHSPSYNPKNQLLIEAKELYKKDRSKKDAFIRKPSFHDEEATQTALNNIRETVRRLKRYKPLMYTTDECGVADLVSAWDFDFDPRALDAMRKWLLEQYGSLEEINREWGTNFATIDEVVPFTTDEIMARVAKGDYNLSPWADHRHFMNLAFAAAVKKATEAVHSVDSDALWGLNGCQMPSAFGGYDYWLLSKAMDVIEPYNIGNNRELWRSFAPEKPAFTTFFGHRDFEIWRLWYQALHGDRGIIIYDEQFRYLNEDGSPTQLGLDIAPSYRELTSGIVRQLAYGKPIPNSVAIHYSHPSITAHWIFDVSPMGPDWVERGSKNERLDSNFLRLRESFVRLMEDNLIDYDFVAYEQLENGEFEAMDKKLLILPQSVAMSRKEAEAVRRFAENGGVVVADCRIALMDNHCKMLSEGQLDELFGIRRASMLPSPGVPGLKPVASIPREYEWAKPLVSVGELENIAVAEPDISPANGAFALFSDNAGAPAVIVRNCGRGKTIYLNMYLTDYHRWRLKKGEGSGARKLMSRIFEVAGVGSIVSVKDRDGNTPSGVELFAWNYGSMKILAFHRNYQNRVSELGPPEYQDQSLLEADKELTCDLGKKYSVYETRTGRYLGSLKEITFSLDKWEPSLFTLIENPVRGLKHNAPASAERGEIVSVEIKIDCDVPGDFHTFRSVVLDPAGSELEMHSANLHGPGGKATWKIPFAVSDAPGTYTIRVRDVATGVAAEHQIELK